MPFLPVIGSAVSAVGGFIQSSQQAKHQQAIAEAQSKPQTVTNTVDYKRMVADAEAAGFNPLTALRAGGSAGFAVQRHPALLSAPIPPTSPIGDFLSGIGGVASAFANMQMQRAEYDLAQAQIANLNADTRHRNMMFRSPSYAGSAGVRTSGGFEVAQPEPLVAARIAGFQIAPDPWWSNAQEIEDRYGDLASWMYGIGVIAADGVETLRQQPRGPAAGASASWQDWVIDQARRFDTWRASGARL